MNCSRRTRSSARPFFRTDVRQQNRQRAGVRKHTFSGREGLPGGWAARVASLAIMAVRFRASTLSTPGAPPLTCRMSSAAPCSFFMRSWCIQRIWRMWGSEPWVDDKSVRHADSHLACWWFPPVLTGPLLPVVAPACTAACARDLVCRRRANGRQGVCVCVGEGGGDHLGRRTLSAS